MDSNKDNSQPNNYLSLFIDSNGKLITIHNNREFEITGGYSNIFGEGWSGVEKINSSK